MQSLPTNVLSGFSATDGANPAVSSTNRLGGAQNGLSTEQSSSPGFASLLAPPDQTPFKSQLTTAFALQALPPEGQLLPPGSVLFNPNGVNNSLTQLSGEGAREEVSEIPLAVDASIVPTAMAVDLTVRSAGLPGAIAEPGAVASQLVGQGQNRLQQDMLARQLALSNTVPGDGELPALRLPLPLDNIPVQGNTTQLSNLFRDPMFKQQFTANSGAEAKISDTFSSTLGTLAALSADAKSTSDTKPLMQSSINTPFSQQANWGEEMSSRIKWMVNSQVQNAELKMNPAHLGPIEVKITVQNDQTTILFTAQNGAVREALDNSIPRLREMLGENGMNQVDVDVSDQQSFAQQQQASAEEHESMEGKGQGCASEADELLDPEAVEEGMMMLSSRMVDYYA